MSQVQDVSGVPLLVQGGPAPQEHVNAQVQFGTHRLAHALKVTGYAVYNLARVCLPDSCSAAIGIGATVAGGPVLGLVAGLAGSMARHVANTVRHAGPEGMRAELLPGCAEAVLFRALFLSARQNPLPLKGGAQWTETFCQSMGDFYRNLCHHGMANAGVCAALCREWMEAMQPDPVQGENLLAGWKGVDVNADPARYVVNQRAYIEDVRDLGTSYPNMGATGVEVEQMTDPAGFGGALAARMLDGLAQGGPVFADISLHCHLPVNHAVTASIRAGGDGGVRMDYFDPNFGQFTIRCARDEAPARFAEFFQDLMARTSYSVGFHAYSAQLMQ